MSSFRTGKSMAPQLYLITPADPDPVSFARHLMAVLSGPDVSALLLRRGSLDDADGVHVTTGGLKSIRAAIEAVKPDGIVGVGNVRSRHDAMSFGELDVDYLMFGPLGGAGDPQAVELAQWWAETFEIPAVHSDPAADLSAPEVTGAEFLALSDSVWLADDPAGALAAIVRALA
jgi:thiamine-phosphate pyrophosphorylase